LLVVTSSAAMMPVRATRVNVVAPPRNELPFTGGTTCALPPPV
jgi:hypothetical protein